MDEKGRTALFAMLQVPTPPEEIKVRQDRGQNLAYIDSTYVIQLLNDTVGPQNWTDTYELLSGPEQPGKAGAGTYVMQCHLTILGVTKCGVGYNDNAEYFGPPKSAESSAFKRAARKFGIGLDLYDEDSEARQQIATGGKAKKTAPPSVQQGMPETTSDTVSLHGLRMLAEENNLDWEQVKVMFKEAGIEKFNVAKYQRMKEMILNNVGQ